MRRESAEDVARETRRRLDELSRHWAPAGEDGPGPGAEDPGGDDPAGLRLGTVETGPVPSPGRHARDAVGRFSVRARVLARLPETGFTGFRRAHLGPIAVIGVLAVLLAGWAAIRPGPQPVPVANTRPTVATSTPPATTAGPEAPTASAPTASTSSTSAPSAVPGAGTPTTGVVVVDVAGKVRTPGVATLPQGSRVVDALRHAGGALPGVDLSTLNLARVLVDGEQVLVGQPAPVAAAPSTAPGTGSAPSAPSTAPISLNAATAEMLEGLPGIGPVTAQKIIGWRTEHGPFSAVDELLEVPGIGPKTLAEIAPGLVL